MYLRKLSKAKRTFVLINMPKANMFASHMILHSNSKLIYRNLFWWLKNFICQPNFRRTSETNVHTSYRDIWLCSDNKLFIYIRRLNIVVFYIHNSYLQFNYSTQESDVKTDLLPYIIRYLLSDNWVCSIISWNYVYSFFIKTTNRLSLMFLECFLLIDLFAQPINLLTFLLKLTYRLL